MASSRILFIKCNRSCAQYCDLSIMKQTKRIEAFASFASLLTIGVQIFFTYL